MIGGELVAQRIQGKRNPRAASEAKIAAHHQGHLQHVAARSGGSVIYRLKLRPAEGLRTAGKMSINPQLIFAKKALPAEPQRADWLAGGVSAGATKPK